MLQLLAAIEMCPTHNPFDISTSVQQCHIEAMEVNDDDPTTVLNCFVQILNDLPESERSELQLFAENPTEPEFMVFIIDTLETELQATLVDLYPGSRWCCILVAHMLVDQQSKIKKYFPMRMFRPMFRPIIIEKSQTKTANK